jgi:hypothetical protein
MAADAFLQAGTWFVTISAVRAIRARVDALSMAIPLGRRTGADAFSTDFIGLAGMAACVAILRVGADIDANAAALHLRLLTTAFAIATELAARTLLAGFPAVGRVATRVKAVEAVGRIGARVAADRTA